MLRSGAQTAAKCSVLRMRGLPFNSSEADIREFFTGFTLDEVRLCVRAGEGIPTIDPAIQSASSSARALPALRACHHPSLNRNMAFNLVLCRQANGGSVGAL